MPCVEKGLYRAFESIRDQASSLLKHFNTLENASLNIVVKYGDFSSDREAIGRAINDKIRETESLISAFRNAASDFARVIDNSPLLYHPSMDDLSTAKARSALRGMLVECNKALGILEDTVSPVPIAEKNKLDDLQKELTEISSKINEVNIEKNLTEAIDECEHGHYLSSWLIAGRVVRYIFEKIPGKGTNEKIEFLKTNKILMDSRETASFILKADKQTRDVASHNMRIFPQPKDSISLLADAVKLVELIWMPLEKISANKDVQ